ncbi:MAG: radical SAM protein [Rhodobacteraceae bacterium]|nr:radical SAM protein [Paracoccaceae bacterium]
MFNFEHRCSLRCPWCYVPFGGAAPEPSVCMRITDELLNYGVDYITFGGGDPSSYSFIEQLVSNAKSGGAFVHLDTNAVGFHRNENSLSWIPKFVDLVGLPIDGDNSEVHASVRGDRRNFDIVTKFAALLSSRDVTLKFNTFLNPSNISSIRGVFECVSAFRPRVWSIYEYWEPPNLGDIRDEWSCSITDLTNVKEEITSFKALFNIELVEKHTRRLNYPIVSHDGRLYTHSTSSMFSYEDIGSIFSKGNLEKAFDLCAGQSEKAKIRHNFRFR